MPRPLRRLLVGLVVLVAVGAAWVASENARGKRKLQSYKGSLVIRGEKLKVEELAPTTSGEAQRAARELIRAAWQFRDGPILAKGSISPMRHVSPGRARVAWREADIRSDRSTRQWSELAAELEQNSQVLEEIRTVLNAPEFNFSLNYNQSFNILLTHLPKLKGVAQRLSTATLNDLHNGKLDHAAANLNALVRLTEVLRDEPLIISQLVRMAIAAIAIGPTWEALQAEGWADAQLAELQERWESLEFMQAMERAIAMERASGIETFERLRGSSAERKQMFSGAPFGAPGAQQGLATPANASDVPDFALELGKKTLSSAGSVFRETAWLWLWSYHDEHRYLEIIQAMLDVPRDARSKGSFTAARSPATKTLDRFFQSGDAGAARYSLAYQIAPALEGASAKAARLETQRQMGVAAIALKRYHLRHNKAAPTLAALVPDFVSSAPRDFMDGKELRYRPNSDGSYLLYSVNEDGQDNGGDPAPPGDRPATRSRMYFGNGRDLVWPMPATAAEVAEAEAKEPKIASPAYDRTMLERYGLIPATNSPPAPAK